MTRDRTYQDRKSIERRKKEEEYICEICRAFDGVERKGEYFYDSVQGHHIIDVKFDGPATPENIIVVCKVCHDKIHRGEIGLDY